MEKILLTCLNIPRNKFDGIYSPLNLLQDAENFSDSDSDALLMLELLSKGFNRVGKKAVTLDSFINAISRLEKNDILGLHVSPDFYVSSDNEEYYYSMLIAPLQEIEKEKHIRVFGIYDSRALVEVANHRNFPAIESKLTVKEMIDDYEKIAERYGFRK